MADDFRSRARAVRMQTRAHLAALRAARRGGSNDAVTDAAATVASAATAPTPADDRVMDRASVLEAGADTPLASAVASATPEFLVAPDATSVTAGDAAPAGHDAGPEPTPEGAVADTTDAHPEKPSTDAAFDGGAISFDAADDDGQSHGNDAHDEAPPADAPAESHASDLALLPGIGPGLIWLFEQRGVRTLSDFAAADPERLRQDIGFIGSLVDFDGWMRFARDHAGR